MVMTQTCYIVGWLHGHGLLFLVADDVTLAFFTIVVALIYTQLYKMGVKSSFIL